MLDITEIHIHTFRDTPEIGPQATATVTVMANGSRIILTNLLIRVDDRGMWVAWPGKQNTKTNKYMNYVLMDTQDTNEINSAIIAEYTKWGYK